VHFESYVIALSVEGFCTGVQNNLSPCGFMFS